MAVHQLQRWTEWRADRSRAEFSDLLTTCLGIDWTSQQEASRQRSIAGGGPRRVSGHPAAESCAPMRSQPALSSTCRRRSEAKPRRKPHQAADAYPTGTHGQQGRPGARPVAQPLTSSSSGKVSFGSCGLRPAISKPSASASRTSWLPRPRTRSTIQISAASGEGCYRAHQSNSASRRNRRARAPTMTGAALPAKSGAPMR